MVIAEIGDDFDNWDFSRSFLLSFVGWNFGSWNWNWKLEEEEEEVAGRKVVGLLAGAHFASYCFKERKKSEFRHCSLKKRKGEATAALTNMAIDEIRIP